MGLLKLMDKMTFIRNTHFIHDLLNTQKSSSQQRRCFPHSDGFEVLSRRLVHFGLEQVTQSRARKIYHLTQLNNIPGSAKVCFESGTDDLNSSVHQEVSERRTLPDPRTIAESERLVQV